MAGVETVMKRPQMLLANARRERLDRLWSSHAQVLLERITERDTISLFSRGLPVGNGL